MSIRDSISGLKEVPKDSTLGSVIDHLTKTFCTVMLFVCCVGFWSWATASNFDQTELTLIGGTAGSAAVWKLIPLIVSFFKK
jgi:hypothetical protein